MRTPVAHFGDGMNVPFARRIVRIGFCVHNGVNPLTTRTGAHREKNLLLAVSIDVGKKGNFTPYSRTYDELVPPAQFPSWVSVQRQRDIERGVNDIRPSISGEVIGMNNHGLVKLPARGEGLRHADFPLLGEIGT